MLTWLRANRYRRAAGFTLIELVVVLAILGIVVSLAVPRYLAARKKAYKVEADNLLQEIKTLEWSYFQEQGAFDTSPNGTALGFVPPGKMHWNAPVISGTNPITITMTGAAPPLSSQDRVWITLASDGSSSSGSNF
jgi:prepilin-type N-terminal cleavage/methylation domain-containing protein